MQTRIAAIAASILAASALLPDGAPAQPAQGQPLAQAMVGSWAVGSVDKCASAPYRVTLDGGTIVFRDHAGKVTRERIEAESPTAMVTRVEENQPGKPVAVWSYERRSADTIAVTNTTTRRAFTIHRCEEPAIAQGAGGDIKVGAVRDMSQTIGAPGICMYFFEQDFRQKKFDRVVAVHALDEKDPDNIKDLRMNLDGKDVVIRYSGQPSDRSSCGFRGTGEGYTVTISGAGRSRSCGRECEVAQTRLEIAKGIQKTTTTIVASW